jgi:methionyl-tRNA synthetase
VAGKEDPMSARRFTVTTSIPYVNGDPHLGFALECVQADVLARHRRLRGDVVRLGSGTDDNALKNVEAARVAGVPVDRFVAAKGDRFEALRDTLGLSYDDFLRTSSDPRHRPGVELLWRACEAAGDLYQRTYSGLYCEGCEAFVAPAELVDGNCAEHGRPPVAVTERNWFFRLSRYRDSLLALLESDALRIEPAARRNEVLSFVRGGLDDFSVSRPRERAGGWGIPVPDDPEQVVYVWFDALGNYLTSLEFGTEARRYRTWWDEADERVHVIGKGIVRFHAVYWPAILLSAGVRLPTAVFVHDYVTAGGRRLSKSSESRLDPFDLASRYGQDALRWWCVRDVPRSGDVDFREELLAARADELANQLGNLVARTVGLVARSRPDGLRGGAPPRAAAELVARIEQAPAAIDAALGRFDLRTAAGAAWEIVTGANRLVATARPWELAHCERETGSRSADLDALLAVLVRACETAAHELRPFLPEGADRIERALASLDPALARTLFPKVAHTRHEDGTLA